MRFVLESGVVRSLVQLPKPPDQFGYTLVVVTRREPPLTFPRHVKKGLVRYNKLLLIIFFEEENIMDICCSSVGWTSKILVKFDLITYVVSNIARREVSMFNITP